MPVLNVRLFGRFSICFGEHVLDGIEAAKTQELFCYLLLRRDHPHPRETLASLLWGDNPTTQAKKYLRQALWQLQATLEAYTEPISGRMLLVEPAWVHLNPDAHLWLDVAVFEEAFLLVQGIPGQELDARRAQSLEHAVQLYQGDLLEGWYQNWCLYERERLQNMYLLMLDKLMAYCEAQRQYEPGLDYGVRILRHDRARERTHQRLMRLYYLIGDRAAALRQYERCTRALQEELQVQPAKQTVQLYEQIRTDHLDTLSRAPGGIQDTSETINSLLPGVLQRLTRLETALADLQTQVQQNIQAIEHALRERRVSG